MDAGVALEEVFHLPELDVHSQAVLARAGGLGVDVITVTPPVLESIAETRSPQGIVAVARALPVRPTESVLRPGVDMVVALDRIADPGNLGTIVRTAEAAGASGVVLVGQSVDPWGPKVVRASAGSAFRLPIIHVSAPQLASAARSAGLQILAADVVSGVSPWAAVAERGSGLLWLFGSESHGLSGDLLALADTRVRIPMAGAVESINLAASVAVCLFSQARECMTD